VPPSGRNVIIVYRVAIRALEERAKEEAGQPHPGKRDQRVFSRRLTQLLSCLPIHLLRFAAELFCFSSQLSACVAGNASNNILYFANRFVGRAFNLIRVHLSLRGWWGM
jgi:hypothetical protein